MREWCTSKDWPFDAKDGLAIKNTGYSSRGQNWIHSPHTVTHNYVCNCSHRGFDALFWPPQIYTEDK